MGIAARDISTVRLALRELIENSAAAMSRRQPGVFFSINDSGNEPLLFALDTTGDRGVWRVANATNVDWESLAIGPCAAHDDVVRLHRRHRRQQCAPPLARHLPRAEPDADGRRATLTVAALRYVYADGPHDVEAMYVAPNGDMLFITKRPLAARRRTFGPRWCSCYRRLVVATWGYRTS